MNPAMLANWELTTKFTFIRMCLSVDISKKRVQGANQYTENLMNIIENIKNIN